MARGVNFLIYANTAADGATPVYTKVAGQRGGTWSTEADTIDLSSKDNAGWSFEDYGVNSWSLDGDGVLVEDDKGLEALEDALFNKKTVLVRWETENKIQYEGAAIVSEFSVEAPHDDVATYKLKLKGQGQYKKIEPTPPSKPTPPSGGGDDKDK